MAVETIPEKSGGVTEFWAGFRLGIPVLVASAPFAVLFGALAVKQGMTPAEVALMSATLYAGASQMVGIELFGKTIAPWLVVFSIFAVNFRHVLYSAAVGRRITHWSFVQKAVGFFFLVDPQYAETERRAETGRSIDFVWYMGMAIPIYVAWLFNSWIGAAFGSLIPDSRALGLDFLLPIYFLGLVMSFRKRPMWVPIIIASSIVSVIAYHTIGSPWHVSIGAAAGILVAAIMAPVRKAGMPEPVGDEV